MYAYDTLIGSNPILLVIFRKVAQIEERAAWDGEVEMAEFSFPTIVITLLVLDGLRNSPTNYHTLFDSMREHILCYSRIMAIMLVL